MWGLTQEQVQIRGPQRKSVAASTLLRQASVTRCKRRLPNSLQGPAESINQQSNQHTRAQVWHVP